MWCKFLFGKHFSYFFIYSVLRKKSTHYTKTSPTPNYSPIHETYQKRSVFPLYILLILFCLKIAPDASCAVLAVFCNSSANVARGTYTRPARHFRMFSAWQAWQSRCPFRLCCLPHFEHLFITFSLSVTLLAFNALLSAILGVGEVQLGEWFIPLTA